MILRRLGVFFYIDFENFLARFLNVGLKMLPTRFCPSFNAHLGVTPKSTVSPQSCETFRKQNRVFCPNFVSQLNEEKLKIVNLIFICSFSEISVILFEISYGSLDISATLWYN